jgi:hypothetical protein
LEVRFRYLSKAYKVDISAYDLNLIVLPDGKTIKANSWLESYPPLPVDLEEVPNVFRGLEAKEIASLLNGVLAVEIK